MSCPGGTGWSLFRNNTGLNEDMERQNIGGILALKSGNNTVGSLLLRVKANALHTAVFFADGGGAVCCCYSFKLTYSHNARPEITAGTRITNQLGRDGRRQVLW